MESRVLEYPSVEEYVEEVKRRYDLIGIGFTIKGFGKVAKMIALARKHAPATKVVLGGFGTALHDVEVLGADYVCRGEGVTFMRDLLGVPQGLEIVHPKVTADITLKIFQNYNLFGKETIGLITSGFGCPNACEFCCTSAYYGHRNVRFLKTGRDIYKVMRRLSRVGIHSFLIFEEDFMLYNDKVEDLGNAIEEHQGNPLSYACFASVMALSNYDFEELVAKGLGHVWIGVESVNASFSKRQGRDIGTIFAELRALGVTTTASSIFGLDHHTPEQLPREVDFLTELYPSTVQLSNLMPAVGTELRRRLEAEGRITAVGYKDADLYSEVIHHPAFKPGEIQTAIFDGYQRLYELMGPSVFRILDTWFAGYRNLRRSRNPSLRKRAELYASRSRAILPIFLKTSEYLPNNEVRYRVKRTLDEITGELGPPTAEQQEQAEVIRQVFAIEAGKRCDLYGEPIEPELAVCDYPSGPEGANMLQTVLEAR
jgi:haloalkane dehalogenase